MLRSISLNKNVNSKLKAIEFMRFMSIHSQNRPKLQRFEHSRPLRENSYVRLCGTIDTKPTKTNNGVIFLSMTTQNAHDVFQEKHFVVLSPSVRKSHEADQFIEDSRLYVIGRISYKEFQSADGNPIQGAQINPHKIFLCRRDQDSSSDVNEVKLCGHVKSKPYIENKIIYLDIATQFFDQKEQCYKSNLHRVMILDDDKIQQQAKYADVGTSVFIQGHLQSDRIPNKSGQLLTTYYIRPTKWIVLQSATNFELNDY